MVRVAINGFGRIGRMVFRAAVEIFLLELDQEGKNFQRVSSESSRSEQAKQKRNNKFRHTLPNLQKIIIQYAGNF